MMTIREYKQAESLEEAWQLNQKKANRVLGGMIWLKMENINVGTAIDLSGLGLDTIEETEDSFSIGAMVTLRQLEEHAGLAAYTHGAVKEALRHIVGVQICELTTRNAAGTGDDQQRGQVAHEHGADMLQTQRDRLFQGHFCVELIRRLFELDFLQMFHSPQILTKIILFDCFTKKADLL